MHKVGNPKLLCCALVTTCQVVQLCKHVLTGTCLQMQHVLILPTFPILSLLPPPSPNPASYVDASYLVGLLPVSDGPVQSHKDTAHF